MKKISIVFFLTFSLLSCDRFDFRLKLINSSEQIVYFIKTDELEFANNPVKVKNEDTLWNHMNYILPSEKKAILSFGKDSWEGLINNNFKDSTIIFYFFSDSLLSKTPFDTLRKYQICSDIKKFKVEDLQKLNWEINFP